MSANVDVIDLTVGFQTIKKTKLVVEEVSFSIKAGETLALVGESGSGKSLTALALMRLLPNFAAFAEKSKIQFENNDLLELPEYLMRQVRGKKIAMIFQDPMSALNPVIRIDKQLTEALHPSKFNDEQLHDKLIELLQLVEIDEVELSLLKYPHQLSGGQKQRIMIAMALARNPELLIADEPTTALDSTTQEAILDLLKKLQLQFNMSLLLITHDLMVVKARADRVCMMYAGQIVEKSLVADFFAGPKHPYAQQLLNSLPSKAKQPYRLPVVSGTVPSFEIKFVGCRFNSRCPYVFAPCYAKTPILQNIGHHFVRCHLYPELKELPSNIVLDTPWPTSVIQANEPLLTIANLHVYYYVGKKIFHQGRLVKAVENVSFQIKPGKTLALVGESGCGKTTISRALLGLIPITAGQIIFKNKEMANFKRRDWRIYRKKVQLVMQDPYASMNPRMTVKEIISEGLVNQTVPAKIIQQKIAKIMDLVNLSQSSLKRYPHQFSGGQRQRICIARALILEPELVICDEPTSALDISVQAQILNLLKGLQLELGISYLFITHNKDVVDYLADEILFMHKGKLQLNTPALSV